MSNAENARIAQEVLAKRTDYYAVLGVRRDAEEKEIRRAYYRLSLRLHPDKNPSSASSGGSSGPSPIEDAYRVVNHCYETLSNANRRAVYDRYGEKGLRRFVNGDADTPSVRDVLSFLVHYWCYSVVRRAGSRGGCAEVADDVFPTTAAAKATAEESDPSSADSFAHQQHSFARMHAGERRAARRLARRALVALSVLLCVLATVDRFVFAFLPRDTDSAAPSSSPVAMSEAERLAQLQEDLFFPNKDSGSAGRRWRGEGKGKLTAGELQVRASCLRLDNDAAAVACCHARHSPARAGGDGNATAEGEGVLCRDDHAADGGRDDVLISVPIFRGSSDGAGEADTVLAFHALVRETCTREALLAAASRERYEDTSTLPHSPAHARGHQQERQGEKQQASWKGVNRAPKRKFSEQRWRPKFSLVYSVTHESELFHLSPVCAHLLSPHAEGKKIG